MPRFLVGKVTKILEERDGIMRVNVKAGKLTRPATVITDLVVPVKVGDEVVLNTTARELDLGTGGQDFVVWNLAHKKLDKMSGGHILKLRYTPGQLDTIPAEAPESAHHAALAKADSLRGMPVVACGLHSQVAAVAAMLKHSDPDMKVAYVMTDGAALPIKHSDLVTELKEKKLIDATITAGHAFGGDYETVNVFTGLLTASEVVSADVAITSVGPGIVGTGSALGHTGMQQGTSLSAAGSLGGRPVAVLRISFADPRERHRGVSHHSLSALRFGALTRCTVAIPDLEIEQLSQMMNQLISAGIPEMHDIRIIDAWETPQVLGKYELKPSTMGRTVEEDPVFFEAAGAAAVQAADFLYEIDQ